MRELTVGKNLTAGSSNTVYTVPKGCKAIATLLMLSNYGGSSKSVTSSWYDHSTNTSVTIVVIANYYMTCITIIDTCKP